MYAIESCVLIASRHCPLVTNLVLNLNYIQNHNYWKRNIFRGDGCHRTRKGKVEETFPTSRWHRGGRESSSKLEELTLGTLLTGGADLSGEVGGGEAYEAARGNPPCSSTSTRGEAGPFSA